MALENNPTLAQAQAEVAAAYGRWIQAGLYPNPEIGYVGEEIGDEGGAGQQGAFVSQEFVTAGKLRLARLAAQQAIEGARHQLLAQRYRVLTSVRIAYYDVLIAQREVAVARQLVKLSDEGVRAAEAMVEAQQAARPDLLQARVEASNARIVLSNAQAAYQAAWHRLATVVGRPNMASEPLKGDFVPASKPLNLSEIQEKLLASSPEIRVAEAQLAYARAALQLAKVRPIPNVSLQAGLQYDYATEDTVADMALSLPLPVFDRNQGNVQAAQSELVSAERELERVRLHLRQRLASVAADYTKAQQAVDRYRREILPNAKTSLDLAAEGYRQGEFDYLRLLTAQRTYFSTTVEYLRAVRRWWVAKLTIDGLLLADGLSRARD